MKYEYMKIEDFRLLSLGITADDWTWLYNQPDVEYRHDYCCFFVLKGSPTHTAITIKLGDVFEKA